MVFAITKIILAAACTSGVIGADRVQYHSIDELILFASGFVDCVDPKEGRI